MTSKIHITRIASAIDGAGPRRIIEDRGELAILRPVGPVYNPCYFDIRPGEGRSRGEHYHRSKTEVFYVISGSCMLRFVDLDTGQAGDFQVSAGDMVTIMPMCAHRMDAIEYCQVMEFSLEDVDYRADTVPYEFESLPSPTPKS
jgi:mannose-6-phosphate isomerase-like protein (cupin superfamily)